MLWVDKVCGLPAFRLGGWPSSPTSCHLTWVPLPAVPPPCSGQVCAAQRYCSELKEAGECCWKPMTATSHSSSASASTACKPCTLGSLVCPERGAHLCWAAVLQVASGDFPHCLFYGPPGAGKKTLIMAVLREVYGPGAEKVQRSVLSCMCPTHSCLIHQADPPRPPSVAAAAACTK